jgi:hypothetical protein
MVRSRAAARPACCVRSRRQAALLVRGAAHPDGCGEVSVIVWAQLAAAFVRARGRGWSIASRYGATAPRDLAGRPARRIVTTRVSRRPAVGPTTARTAPTSGTGTPTDSRALRRRRSN